MGWRREKGRQGKLAGGKQERQGEDGRQKERQARSLERLKQRGRQQRCYGDWNGVDQIQEGSRVRNIQKEEGNHATGGGAGGVQGQAGEGAR